jgi:hypothetical protein
VAGLGAVMAWSGSPAGLPREITPDEGRTLYQAERVAERDCMARLGFQLVLTPDPVPETARSFPFVVDDVAWTRRYGYGLAFERVAAAGRATDPNETYFRGLSPQRRVAALRAFNGDPANGVSVPLPSGGTIGHSVEGCGSTAQRVLYGDYPTWYRADKVDRDLVGLANLRVRRDSKYRAATARWAECAATAGLPYATPEALREALPDSAPKATEIRYAEVEATCAHSSGLARTAADLQRRHLDRLRAEHHDAVATARQRRLQALPTARKLLAASTARS